MDLTNPIDLIITIIGVISGVFGIISFIWPTSTYPIIVYLRNIFNKRLISKELLEITITKNYQINKKIDDESFKNDLKKIFKEYGFKSEIEESDIKGNLERRKLHIENIIELPIENNIILFKQKTKSNFKKLNTSINTLYDLYRDFQKLDYISIYDERISITLKGNIFSENKFLKIGENQLKGKNFIISKNNSNTYELKYVGLDNQETLDNLKNIILAFVEL